jgi:pseudouridine synthase
MERGIDIGDYTTKPCKAKKVGPNSFSIILTEGKKHQIRRMCDVLNLHIETLKRIRVMNIKVDKMKSNQLRKIEGKELVDFLSSLRINTNS